MKWTEKRKEGRKEGRKRKKRKENLTAMAANLIAMASTLLVMASNLMDRSKGPKGKKRNEKERKRKKERSKGQMKNCNSMLGFTVSFCSFSAQCCCRSCPNSWSLQLGEASKSFSSWKPSATVCSAARGTGTPSCTWSTRYSSKEVLNHQTDQIENQTQRPGQIGRAVHCKMATTVTMTVS